MLLEYEQSSIQGRCISLVTRRCSHALDLLFDTAERRNVMLNVLDLCLEWKREEARLIWASFAPSAADAEWARGCESYEDVRMKCPHLLPLADALHASFIQFVEKRDDRLDAVCFDFESPALSNAGVAGSSGTSRRGSLQSSPQTTLLSSAQGSQAMQAQQAQQTQQTQQAQQTPQVTLQAALQANMPESLQAALEWLRPHAKPHPPVLKVFVAIAEALARVKAHLEEGVFRQCGSKEQGAVLKQKVRNVGPRGGREP